MTRARHSCHILWALASGYDTSGLAWLLHGDQAGPEAAGNPEVLQQQLKGYTGQELLDQLQARAKASEGWQVRQLQPGTAALGEAP